MKTKPSKSRVLYIKASSGKVCDAQLSIAGERIQEVGDSEFKFLGMHIRVPHNQMAARTTLKASVEKMLQAIVSAPLTCHQKLHLY